MSCATDEGALRFWVRRAAATLSLGAFAYLVATWLLRHPVLLGMAIPSRHPDRGYFLQQVGQGLLPLTAGIALACVALVPSRVYRAAVTTVAFALVIVLELLFIRGSADFFVGVILALAPAILYVSVARRPAWWLMPVLAAAPLLFALGAIDYEAVSYVP